jgi:hypothetical protein
MTTWRLSVLLVRNRTGREGVSHYLLRVSVLSVLNILLLSGLLTTVSGNAFSMARLAQQYTYFVPLVALTATVGSWETELVSGIGERYVGHTSWIWRSRLVMACVECAVPLCLFTYGLVATRPERLTAHLVTMFGMWLVFGLLGIGLGFWLGFRHEKSVNNLINLMPWVLGIGPGPFFGQEAYGPAVLMPGGFSVTGDFLLEWIKLAGLMALAVYLLVWSSGARRNRFYP